jgi:hypothetical protein
MQHSGNIRLYSGRPTIRYDSLDPAWLDRAIDYLRGKVTVNCRLGDGRLQIDCGIGDCGLLIAGLLIAGLLISRRSRDERQMSVLNPPRQTALANPQCSSISNLQSAIPQSICNLQSAISNSPFLSTDSTARS